MTVAPIDRPLAALAPSSPPSAAERLGWVLHTWMRTIPFFGKPDEAFHNPVPGAGHRVEPCDVPLVDGFVPATRIEPDAWTGAAVLLAHGATTEDFAPYMFYVEALVARGIAVMAIELDGHGRNPRPFSPAGVATNVPAALEAVLARQGVDAGRVGVLGVSLGAACAVKAVAEKRGIRAVCLVGMPVALDIGWRIKVSEFLGVLSPHIYGAMLRMDPARLFSFLVRPMRVLEGERVVRRHILDAATPRAIGTALHHFEPLGDARALAETPVLLLHGAWDAIAPVDHGRRFAAAVGPTAAVVTVPARNHFTVMSCPMAVSAIRDFFERELAPTHTPVTELVR
jgi:alpha-beta hydrolase superfamily lysophospholipase